MLTTKCCKIAPVRFVCLSIHLSVGNNLRTTEWIFMKFDIGKFYKNLLSPSNFGKNRTTTGTLHEDLHMFLHVKVTCGESPCCLDCHGHLGNPQLAPQPLGGRYFVMPSSFNQAGMRHSAHAEIIDLQAAEVTVVIHKGQRSNSRRHARTVTLCVHFVTCLD
jgi:hypothetical protein